MLNILWFAIGLLEEKEFEKYLTEYVGIESKSLEDFYNENFVYWEEDNTEPDEILYVLNLISERKQTNES